MEHKHTKEAEKTSASKKKAYSSDDGEMKMPDGKSMKMTDHKGMKIPDDKSASGVAMRSGT